MPEDFWQLFYGGSLCALTNDSGGIRPIAAGNTLRRLAIKVASKHLVDTLGDRLPPNQLGFGSKRGCETAAHAARQYISIQTEREFSSKLMYQTLLTACEETCF